MSEATKSRKPSRRRVVFRLDAPEAETVYVTGDPWGWQLKAVPLKQGKDGQWTATKYLPAGEYEYRFIVDGEWADDPGCRERVDNEFGSQNCVLRVG
jgi:1,4-alpha-glucan branching enzyme